MTHEIENMSTATQGCAIAPGTEPPSSPQQGDNNLQFQPSSQGVVMGVPIVSADVRRRVFCKGAGLPTAKLSFADSPAAERYTSVLQL